MIENNSYSTVHGRVASFSGAEIVKRDGGWILRIGRRPRGTPTWLKAHGFIQEVSPDDPSFWWLAERCAWNAGLPYETAIADPDREAIIEILRVAT